MKRIIKNLLPVILAGFIPFSLAFGQEKKNEQKIKVVINDGSGEKTVLDTTYSSGSLPGTITLKDGEVIVLEKAGDNSNNVYSYSISKSTGGKPGTKVIIASAGDESSSRVSNNGEKVIVIKDGKEIDNLKEKTVSVRVSTDDTDTDMETTKYIIAKDGIVVTVQGKDEAKTQEIIKEIKNKLGVKNEGEEKSTVKSDVKKSEKK